MTPVAARADLLAHLESMSGHRILLPGVIDFSDLLPYEGEWVYRDPGTKPSTYGHEPEPPAAYIGHNQISHHCWLQLAQTGGPKHRSIRVGRPAQTVLDAVRPRLVTPDDRLSWKVISHERTGLALVILEHGYIIGSHWVAYIDPATIPAPAEAE